MVALPQEVGGAGLGMTTAVLLEEEAANGDPAAAFGFGGPGAFGVAVAELGTPAQAKALLAPFAGSDGWKRFGAVAWGEKKASSQRAGLGGDGDEARGYLGAVRREGVRRERGPRGDVRRVRAGGGGERVEGDRRVRRAGGDARG